LSSLGKTAVLDAAKREDAPRRVAARVIVVAAYVAGVPLETTAKRSITVLA
jgi:hypothetical protein